MSEFALGEAIFGTDALSSQKLFSVDGWTAIVTGGGSGLGLVTAMALAENGCRVYITGRRLEVLQDAAKKAQPSKGNGRIIPVQGDVSSKEGIMALKAEFERHEKYLNLLVNNAGVSIPHGDWVGAGDSVEAVAKEMFENDSFEDWEKTQRINTTSYFFTSIAFLPLLAAAKTVGKFSEPGNVLCIASLSGITRTSQRGQFNYNSGKAATRHLALMMSTEFARKGFGIRVNCINPGYFPSGMSVQDFPDAEGPEEAAKIYSAKYAIPFARVGTARDYAQCVLGIVTNGYMTGADVVIDGAWLATQTF